jgi:hypothetical protein
MIARNECMKLKVKLNWIQENVKFLYLNSSFITKISSKFVDVVIHVTCMYMCCVWISVTTLAVQTAVSCGFCLSVSFCLSVQANARIVPQLGQNYFLVNPFKFIIYHSANHLTLFSLRYWHYHEVTINTEVLESSSLVPFVKQGNKGRRL